MFGRETTPGTAVTPTATIPFREGDIIPKQEIITNSPIKGNRWAALNAVAGKISAEGGHTFDLDPNFAAWIFSLAMGTHNVATVSSDTTAYKHTITMATCDVPTFTMEQMKGGVCSGDTYKQKYQVDLAYGAVIDEFEVSASDSIAEVKTKVKALGVFQMARLTADVTAGASKVIPLKDVEGIAVGRQLLLWKNTPAVETVTVSSVDPVARTVTVATLVAPATVAQKSKVELIPTAPNWSTPDNPFSFYQCRFQEADTIANAASAALSNYEDWTLAYKNNFVERYGSKRQSASVLAAKRASASLKFSRYYTDNTKRDEYKSVEPRAIIITMTNDVQISATDTNKTKYSIVIKLPKVIATSYEMPTGNDELYGEEIEAEIFYDNTLGYAMQVEVTNAKPNTYYGV